MPGGGARYGQVARLMRPELVDARLSAPASDEPPPDVRPVRTLDDVTAGLPVDKATAAQIQALVGGGSPGFAMAREIRKVLEAVGAPPGLVVEAGRRAARYVQAQRAAAPPPRAAGQVAALGLRKAGGPFIGPRGGKWADPQHTIPWHEDDVLHSAMLAGEGAYRPDIAAIEARAKPLEAAGDRLTDDEIDAARHYTGWGATPINGGLRNGHLDAEHHAAVASLDSAIAKAPLPIPVTLYRGVSGRGAQVLRDAGLTVGAVIRDKAFVSTSLDAGTPMRFSSMGHGGVILRIAAKPGNLGLYVGNATGAYRPRGRTLTSQNESEVILPRGTGLRVLGMAEHDVGGEKRTVVDVEIA